MATQLPSHITTLLDAAADKHGVPRHLARGLAWVESRGDATAVSPKGAQGVLQLMPPTAKALGVTDAFDPAQNIDAGVRYLAKLIKTFGERAGIAAYNWGPGRVSKAPDERAWPGQIQEYVTNVLQRADLERVTMGGRAAANPLAQTPPRPRSARRLRQPPPLPSSPSHSSSGDDDE